MLTIYISDYSVWLTCRKHQVSRNASKYISALNLVDQGWLPQSHWGISVQPLVLWVVSKPVRSRLTPAEAQRPLGSCTVNELKGMLLPEMLQRTVQKPISIPTWLELVLSALVRCWPCQVWSGCWEPIDSPRTKLLQLFSLGAGLQQERCSLTFSTASVLTQLVSEHGAEAMAEWTRLMSGKV